jgi:hypothetical protein
MNVRGVSKVKATVRKPLTAVTCSDFCSPCSRPLTRPATAGESAVAGHPLPRGEG